MYLIEKIQFETLQNFQDKLNAMYAGGFEVMLIIDYDKGGFKQRNEATVLFKERS